MEANRLVIEWDLNLNSEVATEEAKQFLVWRSKFQTLCKRTGHLEAVRYASWRLEIIKNGAGILPPSIAVAGFDRINPALQNLKQALMDRGVEVTHQLLTFDTPQLAEHRVITDQDAECRADVYWAKQQLEDKPQASIAIVVPELSVLRSKLSNLLDDVLHPQTVRPGLSEAPRCYDFSLGVPLSTQPIIADALHLLRLAWQRGSILQQDVASLLQSPYWSEGLLEADARALLDARMRRELPLSFKVSRLQNYVQKVTIGDGGMYLPATTKALQGLFNFAQAQEAKQPPSVWGKFLQAALNHADWPGQRSLSSHEYQARKSFDSVLAQLSSLDDLLSC
jgi:exodeoxyribonuclease-5